MNSWIWSLKLYLKDIAIEDATSLSVSLCNIQSSTIDASSFVNPNDFFTVNLSVTRLNLSLDDVFCQIVTELLERIIEMRKVNTKC